MKNKTNRIGEKLPNKKSSNPFLKFDLAMKMSFLLIIVALFSMKANDVAAQRTKISLNLDNVTITQLIDKIESTSDYRFVYKIEDVELKRVVSINVKKERIE
ncbi:MAG TPA: hypothetical protein DCS19_00505, partial [Flavobacterium sp.]|nr:hypothetical protein [Flavobacterium sp.]